jgi:hypothetical protein
MENFIYFKNNLKYRIYWVDKDKNKIILKDNSKTNSRKKILNKFSKRNKPINLIRITLSFHSGNKILQGGKVKINIKQFIYKDNKLQNNSIVGENGNLWINNNFFTINKLNQKKTEELLLKTVKNLPNKKLKLLAINILAF